MARWYSAAATALALFTACSNHSTDNAAQPTGDPPAGSDPGSGASGQSGTGADPGTGSDPGGNAGGDPGTGGGTDGGTDGGAGATCPLGVATYAATLGQSNLEQEIRLFPVADGSLIVRTFGGPLARPDDVRGTFKLSPSGDSQPMNLPPGAFATDRAGNLYVASSFTEPVDLGLGVMQPEGNIDVFVAKFDPDGHILFARPLHLCGDGVSAIAVDATGRIAVSGTALGTAVLSADGDIQFTVSESGRLAFDSRGDLVIAGSTSNSAERFLLLIDTTGQAIWKKTLSGVAVHVNGVVIDSHDNIVLVGDYESIDLFGDTFVAHHAEPGRVTGAFVIKLDATGQVVWKHGDLGYPEANDVVIDAQDNIIVVGASAINTGFRRAPVIARLDPAGNATSDRFVGSPAGSPDGRAVSVAVDACGSYYVGFVNLDRIVPIEGSQILAYVVKYSRAP